MTIRINKPTLKMEISLLTVFGVLTVVSVGHLPTTHALDGESNCQSRPADIVFVLDASNSIWPPHFEKQIRFVKRFIDSFDIGFESVRMGVVTFGAYAKLTFHLYHYGTADRMKEVLDNVQQAGSYTTNTAGALLYMRQESFRSSNGARPGVVKIGIIITDGASANWQQTNTQARLAREAGIHLFAIGVGFHVNVTELIQIASSPKENYVFEVHDYDSLESIRHLLHDRTCKVTDPPPTTTLPTTTPMIVTTAKSVETTSGENIDEGTTALPVVPEVEVDVVKEAPDAPKAEALVQRTTPAATMAPTTPGKQTTAAPKKKTVAPKKKTDVPKQKTAAPKPTKAAHIMESTAAPVALTTGAFARRRSTTELTWEEACGVRVPVDIVFLIPGTSSTNNTNLALRYIYNLTTMFDLGDDRVRFGMVPTECHVVGGFRLDEHYGSMALQKELNASYLRIDDVANKIRRMRTVIFSPCSGARPGVKQIAVIILDKLSDDLCAVILEAVAARREGISVFVVAVGGPDIQMEAEEICSHPAAKTVISVESYEELYTTEIILWQHMQEHCAGAF